ncbi:MAG: hypothetical protein ACR2IR_07920 [Acidimicrobiia bacterium]
MKTASVLVALSGALLACGGGGDEGSSTEAQADEIAACAEDAGFDPNLSSDTPEEGATAVDLTTETATIVVQVFESEEDAAAYEPPLESEQVGEVLILGGAIPPRDREKIRDCISA